MGPFSHHKCQRNEYHVEQHRILWISCEYRHRGWIMAQLYHIWLIRPYSCFSTCQERCQCNIAYQFKCSVYFRLFIHRKKEYLGVWKSTQNEKRTQWRTCVSDTAITLCADVFLWNMRIHRAKVNPAFLHLKFHDRLISLLFMIILKSSYKSLKEEQNDRNKRYHRTKWNIQF